MDGMEDEGHFRTNTSSINGQAMSPSATPVAGPVSQVSTSDESLVRDSQSEVVPGSAAEEGNASSAKCRKRTASASPTEAEASTFRTSVICRPSQHVTGSEDNSSDGGVSSRSSSGKSARKRFRSDPESDGIANGEANDDDDGNNS